MPIDFILFAVGGVLPTLGCLDIVAYLDDGTTLCGFLYPRLTGQTIY